MRCHKAQEFISLSLDDAIGEYDRSQLVQHLEGCDECAGYQRALERGSELLRAAPLVEPSDNFEWKVQLGIQKALRDGSRAELPGARPTGLWLAAGLSAAASALLVIGLGWGALQSGLLEMPVGAQQPTSANARPGAQIVDNLEDLTSSPNLGDAIPAPEYQAGWSQRGGPTPVSGRRVVPGAGETANPGLNIITVDDFLGLQRENQLLRLELHQRGQLILSLQRRLSEAHISDAGDSGATAQPR